MRKFVLNLFQGKGEKTAPIPTKCAPNGWASDVASPATVIDGVEDSAIADGGVSGGAKTLFGVKSYLNYFYLSPTTEFDGTTNFAAPPSSNGVWYLLPPPPCRRRAARLFYLLFYALTVIGLLLLLGGAFAIVVGYCWPTLDATLNRIQRGTSADDVIDEDVKVSLMRIAVDQDEEGNFYIPPKRFAELLRDPMHSWKITGFCMFAVGASLMAFSLLVTSVLGGSLRGARCAAIFADAPPSEQPIRIYPGNATGAVDPAKFHIEPTRRATGNRISPTSGPVPTGFEELARVQPSGLRKSPSTPTPGADDTLLLDSIVAKGGDETRPLLPTASR